MKTKRFFRIWCVEPGDCTELRRRYYVTGPEIDDCVTFLRNGAPADSIQVQLYREDFFLAFEKGEV